METPDTAAGPTPAGPDPELDRVLDMLTELLEGRRPGPDDDLIAAGLDSLRMMAAAGRWRSEGHRGITFARLSAEPTARAWAELLAAAAPPAPDTEPEAVPAPDTAPDAGETPFPLAPMQHAYLAGRSTEDLYGGVAAHLVVEFAHPGGAGIPSAELAARFPTAVAELARAHPMLRTRILPDGTQATMPAPDPRLTRVTDLTGEALAAADAHARAIRDERSRALLPVEEGVAASFDLVLMPDGGHRVLLDVDMLVGDAQSHRVLTSDLARALRGEAITPPATPYRIAAAARPAAPARPEGADEWDAAVDAIIGDPGLPTRAATPDPHRTIRLDHRIDADATARLRATAATHGLTPAALVAAAFAEAVSAYTAEERLTLNVPRFDRPDDLPDIDRVVGDFTSSVLVDVDCREPLPLAERARGILRTMHLRMGRAGWDGLSMLREAARRRGAPVLAPIVFTSALGLGDLFSAETRETLGEPVWIVSQGPQVLLDAQITEFDGGLLLNWDVRAGILEEGVPEAMFRRYLAILDAVMDAADGVSPFPPAPLSARDSDARRRRDSVAATDPRGLLHDEFFARASTRGDRTAIVDAATGERLTHAQLADAAADVAAYLTETGVTTGDTVAIAHPKGIDHVVACLGVLAAGACYVPLSPDDPAPRRARILTAAGARTALVPDRAAAAALPAGVTGVTPDRIPHRGRAEWEPVPCSPESPAYVLFTSGSTGAPKGVEVPHGAARSTIDAITRVFHLGADDSTLYLSAPSFDLSVFDVFAPLLLGGSIVVVPESGRREPAAWRRAATEYGATVVNCAPALLDAFLAVDDSPLPALRVVIVGGDWVASALADRVAAIAPGARFAGLGGATEAAIHSTFHEVPPGDAEGRPETVPYGRPLPGVAVRVVDAAGRDRPDGVPGELWIGGAALARGYRGDPDRTAERFPVVHGERWYRTGDRARLLPDGVVEFLGRTDHQVKIRGHRVELGEVEAALRGVPGITRAFAAPHEGGLLAAVEAPGGGVEAEAVRAHVGTLLPAHMVPGRVLVTSSFPLTGHGKIDRAGLLAEAASAVDAPVPGGDGPFARALAVLFGEVLTEAGRSPGEPGSEPPTGVPFIALGGDSLTATTVMVRVREYFPLPDAGVGDLLAAGTAAALARRLVDTAPAGVDEAVLDEIGTMIVQVAGMTEAEIAEELAAGR